MNHLTVNQKTTRESNTRANRNANLVMYSPINESIINNDQIVVDNPPRMNQQLQNC